MPVDTELNYKGCQFISETPDTIFSVEQFSGDEPLMIQTAEQFSRTEVVPLSERLEKQEDGLMPELIRKAGELGLTAVEASEAYGGLGLGKKLSARILEYMSLNASMSVTFGVTTGIGQVGLTLFGTEKQKAQYLPKLVSGESIAAYCLSEPNSGSDALSVTTRADFKDGKWMLNGTKMWISNAKWADHFLVMAKIGGEKFSAFLVERGFPGISISREEHKLGLKGSSTARVVFEDAEVPEENLLHQPGLGHQVALNALNLGRFKLSAMSIGPARDAIGLAAQYALDRRQFGQTISNFGLIRQKFAEMAARFYVAESMIYRTGAYIDSAFDAWAGTIEGNRKAAEHFSVECSICKVFCSDVESLIVDEALQCYGGYGFTEEFPIARHYRDARISKIYEGTNEINRVFIASRIQRRFETGELSPASDGFIAGLAAKAIASCPDDQIRQGALSDLIILSYAEQSARIRAQMTGGINQSLFQIAAGWMNSEAARAFQIATGESVLLPPTGKCDWHEISDAVFAKLGPLS
jgi:alkylation response protein AidB-like acyl-CoA dehydrogenase